MISANLKRLNYIWAYYKDTEQGTEESKWAQGCKQEPKKAQMEFERAEYYNNMRPKNRKQRQKKTDIR